MPPAGISKAGAAAAGGVAAGREAGARSIDPAGPVELDLADFSLDFDDVVIPKTQWSDAEIEAAADSFVARLLD